MFTASFFLSVNALTHCSKPLSASSSNLLSVLILPHQNSMEDRSSHPVTTAIFPISPGGGGEDYSKPSAFRPPGQRGLRVVRSRFQRLRRTSYRFSSSPIKTAWRIGRVIRSLPPFSRFHLVEGGGFEPPKAEPSDLQSDPFGHSGTPPSESRAF